MDIRTKLVFTLVAVALVSMFVLGVFAFEASRSMLEAQALRQLESLAEGKRDDLDRARSAWRDRVRLVSSRTQLRLSVRDFARTGDPEERDRIVRILDDARASVRSLLHAAVLGSDGRLLAESGVVPENVLEVQTPVGAGPAPEPRLGRGPDGRLFAVFHETMELEGRPVGIARVVLAADELESIARDYTGLGETGETLVVRATEDGGAEILTPPRRPDVASGPHHVPSDREDSPALRAARGESGSFFGVDDHSGHAVWASTRPLHRPGWGVVVKLDAAEAELPALELRETLVRLALSLSALAVLAGFVLALFISRPIRDLAAVAVRIRAGQDDVRADTDREDEIGELARAFNGMTEELIAANEELARRIEKQREEDAGTGT